MSKKITIIIGTSSIILILFFGILAYYQEEKHKTISWFDTSPESQCENFLNDNQYVVCCIKNEKFYDCTKREEFKTEEEMQKELKNKIDSWKKDESRDGYIIRAEGDFVYKKIFYSIRVLRYFNHTNKFTNMNEQKISDCHVVVKYPDKTKPLVDLVKEIEEYYLKLNL